MPTRNIRPRRSFIFTPGLRPEMFPIDAMFFGGVDMAAELRCRNEWEPLLHARSRLVHAAASAGDRQGQRSTVLRHGIQIVLDAVTDASGGRFHRIATQMSVPGGSLNLSMSEKLPDHRQARTVQNLRLPQLADNLVRLVALPCHR